MTTDHLTKIITAAPSIRAELWQGVAAATIEQLATVTAERDAARADADEIDAAESERDTLTRRVADLRERIAMVTAERDIARADRVDAIRDMADAHAERDAMRAKVAELEAEVRVSDQRLADQHDEWSRRVRELEARPVLTVERLAEALDAHGHAALARKVFAHLGPVTLPLPAPDRAEELCRVYHDGVAVNPIVRPPSWSEYTTDGRVARVEAMRAALVKVADPSPAVAPGPVLAGVSEGDIACIAANAHRECIDGSPWMDVARAVVARLGASLVAPVDPEAVARDYHDDGSGPSGVPYWTDMGINSKRAAKDTMRATLIAHGIPVTPEAGK